MVRLASVLIPLLAGNIYYQQDPFIFFTQVRLNPFISREHLLRLPFV